MPSPKPLSKLMQLWAKDPKQAARLISLEMSGMDVHHPLFYRAVGREPFNKSWLKVHSAPELSVLYGPGSTNDTALLLTGLPSRAELSEEFGTSIEDWPYTYRKFYDPIKPSHMEKLKRYVSEAESSGGKEAKAKALDDAIRWTDDPQVGATYPVFARKGSRAPSTWNIGEYNLSPEDLVSIFGGPEDIGKFAGGGKVIPFISKGIRDFRSDLLSKVRARSEEIARKTEEYQGWQFEPGDRIMGDKGVYTILGRTWDTKHDRPMYRYETSGLTEDQEGWHQGMFDAEKAHQSLRRMTGPIKKAKGGSIARALRAMRGSGVPKKLGNPEIIKEPGGNWLPGAVEHSVNPLKTIITHPPVGQRIGEHVVTQQMIDDYVASKPDKGLNDWIDKQLTRYMKNEMGTARDPIRKLAEEGVLHVDPDELNVIPNWKPGPYSLGVLGQSPEARRWEGGADNTISPYRVDAFSQAFHEKNQWMKKLAPSDLVYGMRESARGLGFDHLTDELRNALNPESGLPANLLLNPRSMSRLSVPQAVQRVHDINKWRANRKVTANLARANNPATVLYKEYPENNPLGLRWVELKVNDKPPEGWTQDAKGYAIAPGEEYAMAKVDDPRYQDLAAALKYEGDMLEHCVGGYCNDVLEGRSRIFSLRDAKGQPHVTIETSPGKDPAGFLAEDQLPESVLADLKKRGLTSPRLMWKYDENLGRYTPEMGPFSDSIVQVKGKRNSAPNATYLPFVQDFVRSGKWSEVGDLKNTGLRPSSSVFNENELRMIREAGLDIPDYLTAEEISNIRTQVWGKDILSDSSKGYSSGGSVMDPTWHMMNMIYG